MHHRNNFDTIRLFAAILVLCGHTYPLIGKAGPQFLGFPMHHYGIAIFFSVSGYLIAHSWERDPNIFRYLLRRCLRIFPGLIAVTVLTIAVVGPLMTTLPMRAYFADPLTVDYLNNIRLHIRYALPGVFEQNPYPRAVNGSLWSLPAEFFMYLVVPFLVLRAQRIRIALLACVAVGFIAVDHWLTARNAVAGMAVFYATDVRAAAEMGAYFLFGALIRAVKPDLPIKISYAAIAVAAFAIAYVNGLAGPVQQILLTATLTYAVIAVGENRIRFLPNAARFGDFSYGVYLYAFPIQQMVIQKLGANHSPVFLMGAAFVPTLVFGVLSWHLIEKRAIALKPSSSRPRSAAEVLPTSSSEGSRRP